MNIGAGAAKLNILLSYIRLDICFVQTKCHRVTPTIKFHYFERSCEELALLKRYDISPKESIGSATNKVKLHFQNIAHSYENI